MLSLTHSTNIFYPCIVGESFLLFQVKVNSRYGTVCTILSHVHASQESVLEWYVLLVVLWFCIVVFFCRLHWFITIRVIFSVFRIYKTKVWDCTTLCRYRRHHTYITWICCVGWALFSDMSYPQMTLAFVVCDSLHSQSYLQATSLTLALFVYGGVALDWSVELEKKINNSLHHLWPTH